MGGQGRALRNCRAIPLRLLLPALAARPIMMGSKLTLGPSSPTRTVPDTRANRSRCFPLASVRTKKKISSPVSPTLSVFEFQNFPCGFGAFGEGVQRGHPGVFGLRIRCESDGVCCHRGFRVSVPPLAVDRMTKAVMVHTTRVSINGSRPATTPSRTGSLVWTAEWAIGAEPCPASEENKALLDATLHGVSQGCPR